MARVLPRTNFHSSNLIRCLADLAIVDVVEPGNAFAEKLGTWIHFTDAITLSAVHGDGIATAHRTQPDAHSAARTATEAEFGRVRAMLSESITKSCTFGQARTYIKMPAPILELPLDVAAAYAPYRRFYEAHQRDMELCIQPVRVNVREAMAKLSPKLRKLAELDATFEKILRERESKLLSKIPVLLKKHFERLFKAHQQKLADTQQEDNPARWTQSDAWLGRFCSDMRMLLLAEAEFRWLPTAGLMEAINRHDE